MNLYEFEYDNGNIAEIEAKSEAEAIKAFKKINELEQSESLQTSAVKKEIVDKTLLQNIKDSFNNRTTFQALGGAAGVIPAAKAGAVVGSVGGPIGSLVGGVTGGILGGLAGGQIYDITQSLATGETKTVPEQFKQLGKDVKEEVAYNLAGAAIPAVGGSIIRTLGAGGVAARKAYETGVKSNIPQSISTVSKNALVEGYTKTLGVFPFTGGPIRKEAIKRTSVINAKKEDILNAFGQNVHLGELGIDMTQAARSSYLSFKDTSSSLYKDFIETTKELNDPKIFKLTNTQNAVEAIEIELKRSPVKKSPRSDAVFDFLKQIKEIPGNIDPLQYRSLQEDIGYLFKTAGKEGKDTTRLTKVKKALEKDFNMPVINSKTENIISGIEENTIVQSVLESHALANSFYAEGMAKFNSPMARKFKQVDKNIFGPGAEISGTINADELTRKVLKIGSPQSIQQLRTLVGDKQFAQVRTAFVNDAFEDATTRTKTDLNFNVDKLSKSLGFTGKKIENVEGLEELLKGTSVSVENFADFLSNAARHTNTYVPNSATFLQRRILLGSGALSGAAIAAGVTAGSIAAAPITAVGILMVGRMGSKLLANPKNLKTANTLLDFKTPRMVKWQTSMRVLTEFINEKDITEEDKEGFSILKEEIKKNKPGRKLP
jgi:hypothetical protein|tara:strand:+ start:490 stop:2469 length:1980 start_codon:yes stop_codon:yes gene_type:complete